MPQKAMETQQERKERSDRYVANLKKSIDNAKEAVRYSSDRFDILLISLSTGSLLFSMAFAKDFVPDLTKADTTYLKTAWLLFSISLIANLISQVTGYYAHKMEIRVSKNLIKKKRGKELTGRHERMEWWGQAFDYSTISLNALSLITLICGILALVRFSDMNI